jgi:hypothetical protein
MADATAKFLAGLPVRGTPLENQSHDPAWAEHATDLDRAWERLEKQQLAKIRAWAPEYLGPLYGDNGPMFYMFSGPDFLYANAFFPNASTYISVESSRLARCLTSKKSHMLSCLPPWPTSASRSIRC